MDKLMLTGQNLGRVFNSSRDAKILSIMTLTTKLVRDTQHNDTQHNNALHYAEFYEAECSVLILVLLSVVMLSVFILNVMF
jgi:hypothetical protein